MYGPISDQSSTTPWVAQPHIFGRPPANTFRPPSSVRGVSWLHAAVAPRFYDAASSSFYDAAPEGSYGVTVAPSSYGAPVAPSFYGAASATSLYGAAVASSFYGAAAAPSLYGAAAAPSLYGAAAAPSICSAIGPLPMKMSSHWDHTHPNPPPKMGQFSSHHSQHTGSLPAAQMNNSWSSRNQERDHHDHERQDLFHGIREELQEIIDEITTHNLKRKQEISSASPYVSTKTHNNYFVRPSTDDAIAAIFQKFEEERMETIQRLEDDRQTYLAEFVLHDGISSDTTRILGSPSQSLGPLSNNSNPTLTTQEDPSSKEGPQFGAQHSITILGARRNVEDPFYAQKDNKASNVILEELCRLLFDLHFLPLKLSYPRAIGSTQVAGQTHDDTSFRNHVSSWTIHVFDPGGLHNSNKFLFAGIVQLQFLDVTSLSAQEPSYTTTFVFDPGGCTILINSEQLEPPITKLHDADFVLVHIPRVIWVFDPGGIKRRGRRLVGKGRNVMTI